MNAADYSILAVLAISMIVGALRGFLREAIGLIAWLGGLWLAWHYSHLLTPLFAGHIAHPPVDVWVARALILIAALLVGWFVASVLGYFLQHSGLSILVDRLLGLFFGVLRALVILAVAAMLAQLVNLDQARWWKRSRLIPYTVEVSDWIRAFAETGADKRDPVKTEV
jgi:membrane protein required for colicin V production